MIFIPAPRCHVTLTVIEGGTPGAGSIDISDCALWTLLSSCYCRADRVLSELLEEIEDKCTQRATDPTLWLSVHSDDTPAHHHGGTIIATRETDL